ncbi:MAG: Murein DD-endopeptidase MepM [Calditrichaeota bacterium]|nr:Murein DD-endopeptidase MepM [Calditrichota bacterium]
MRKKHQMLWYGPGRVKPREFVLSRLGFLILLLVPFLFTAAFVVGVVFYVSFNLRVDELQTLREENERLRGQISRIAELEAHLTELERFQQQVRRGLTEGADLKRIMEAGEAVERERPHTLNETDWLPVAEAMQVEQAEPVDLLAVVETDGSIHLPERWPVDGFITRGFDFSEIDPGRSHTGIDLAAPRGTPVRAVASGTVVSADWTPRYGNRVILDHGGGMLTTYGHNELLLVAPGDRVSAGAPLALSGNSGISTAPHLHFEIWLNGRAVDPRALLPKQGEHDEEG